MKVGDTQENPTGVSCSHCVEHWTGRLPEIVQVSEVVSMDSIETYTTREKALYCPSCCIQFYKLPQ